MQAEIIYIKKLIRMRKAAERLGCNKKAGVIGVVNWLERHIKANGYASELNAKRFLIRHADKVEYIIPSGKPKLRAEFALLTKAL